MADKNFNISLRDGSDFYIDNAYQTVDPESLYPFWEKEDVPEEEFPEQLTLKVAEIDDIDRIREFFDSKRKQKADPNDFVRPRGDEHDATVLTPRGQIAFIEDHNADIIAISFSFLHRANDLPDRHIEESFTEVGTVLSTAKGVGLSTVIVSALAQATRERRGEDHRIIAKVYPGNDAANGLFKKAMAWDQEECEQTIESYFNSGAGDTAKKDGGRSERNFYQFGEAAVDKSAELLYMLKNDGKLHTKAGKEIPFGFDKDSFHITFDNKDRVPDEYWTNTVKIDHDDPNTVRIAELYNANLDSDAEGDAHLAEAEKVNIHENEEEHTEIDNIVDTSLGPFESLDQIREEELHNLEEAEPQEEETFSI